MLTDSSSDSEIESENENDINLINKNKNNHKRNLLIPLPLRNNNSHDSVPQSPDFQTDHPIFLRHKKTAKDIELRKNKGRAYPLRWYGKPYRSSCFKDINGNKQWAIRTLWSDQSTFHHEKISEMMELFNDFKQKIVNEYPDIMNEINQTKTKMNKKNNHYHNNNLHRSSKSKSKSNSKSKSKSTLTNLKVHPPKSHSLRMPTNNKNNKNNVKYHQSKSLSVRRLNKAKSRSHNIIKQVIHDEDADDDADDDDDDVEEDDEVNWQQKATKIINEISNKLISAPFLCAVDEERDEAPGYYDLIKEPMDLTTLKKLIQNDDILTPKKFVSNLMQIWINAQKYNYSPTHRIHLDSKKLESASKKLIKKYFKNTYKSLYESRRKSNRINANSSMLNNDNNNDDDDNNKLTAITKYDHHKPHKKTGQSLLCSVCNHKLEFLCGFHKKCNRNQEIENIKCNQCNEIFLNDVLNCYYHCVECCNSAINQNDIYLCQKCAEINYESKQVYINNNSPNQLQDARNLAFRGLWIDLGSAYHIDKDFRLWYEAIIIEQESNKTFIKLIFSTEFDFRKIAKKNQLTKATIFENEENELMFEHDKHEHFTEFNKAILSSSGKTLKYIHDTGKEEENYKLIKVTPKCDKCNKEMLFMNRNILPDFSPQRYCDVHHLYYGKNKKLLKKQNNNNNVCHSLHAFDYSKFYKNRIYEVAFYYTCIECNNFDICGGCILCKKEMEYIQERNESNKNNKVQIISDDDVDIDVIDDIDDNQNKQSIFSPPPKKKQRIERIVLTDNINRNNKKSKIVKKKQKSKTCRKRKRSEIAIISKTQIIDANKEDEDDDDEDDDDDDCISNVVIRNIDNNRDNERNEHFKILYRSEKEKNDKLQIENDELRLEKEKWKYECEQLRVEKEKWKQQYEQSQSKYESLCKNIANFTNTLISNE